MGSSTSGSPGREITRAYSRQGRGSPRWYSVISSQMSPKSLVVLARRGIRSGSSENQTWKGAVSRSFQLPMDIDQAQAKAKYDNGVLTLTLPKKLTNGSQRLTIE